MVDKRYVRYKDKFKVKDPHKADHLAPYKWKPGQSGNPDGRPTGSISITETLKAYLRRHPDQLEQIVIALVNEGRLGNIVATKEMLDRIDGRVAERHKIEGELPVKLMFVPAQELLENKTVEILEGEVLEIKEGDYA